MSIIIKNITAFIDKNDHQEATDLEIKNDYDQFLQIEITSKDKFKGLITLDKYEAESLLSSIKDTIKKIKYPK